MVIKLAANGHLAEISKKGVSEKAREITARFHAFARSKATEPDSLASADMRSFPAEQERCTLPGQHYGFPKEELKGVEVIELTRNFFARGAHPNRSDRQVLFEQAENIREVSRVAGHHRQPSRQRN